MIDGLALALEGGLVVLPVFAKHGPLGETSVSAAVVTELGPLVDIYPWLDDPSHLTFGVAWARASFMGSTQDIGSFDNIVELEAVSGLLIQGGAGYDLTDSFGLTVRGKFAFLSGEHSKYRPGGVLVEAAYVVF